MAFNSSGEVSYLVLDSLSHGAKYGLEIIEYISNKTGGTFVLKKPTLYSCLTRMEKKGYLSSSFWSESDMGGKRHYYNLTPAGKAALEELSAEFANISYEQIARDLSGDEPIAAVPTQQHAQEQVQPTLPEQSTTAEDKTVVLQQDNIFNMVEKPQPQSKPQQQSAPESPVLENQMDIFSMPAPQPKPEPALNQTQAEPTQNQEKREYYQSILEQTPVLNDAVFLDDSERLTTEQAEQNRKLFDTSSELKKYRKRKSFSENQIEMAVVYEKEDDQEIQRQHIAELKAAMLEAKQNHPVEPLFREEIAPQAPATAPNFFTQATSQTTSQNPQTISQTSPQTVSQTQQPIPQDDAIFITSRFSDGEIPVQKKIAPTNISVDVSDGNLPAPKRNANLEPTYRDMMSKLFERKKEKEQEKRQAEQRVSTAEQRAAAAETPTQEVGQIESFADYGTLQKYYAGHGIEFKEYKKSSVQRVHNTNFLRFISSAILLLLSGIGCAVLFGILAGAKVLNTSTNFMFYTIPAIFAVYAIFSLIRYQIVPSRKAVLTYTALQNWAIFALFTVIVVVVNVICGMQAEAMTAYLTSLLTPILAAFLAFPCNFHLRKYLYKKYAK